MMSGLDLRSCAVRLARGPLAAAAATLACAVAAATIACGPAAYVNQVTLRASKEIAGAKAVDAERYSPYYYTLAVEYLHKAREEAAHADYQAANRFGHKAEQAARKAREEALVNRADPNFEPIAPAGAGDGAEPDGDDGEASGGGASDGMAPLLDESPPDDEGDDEGDDDDESDDDEGEL